MDKEKIYQIKEQHQTPFEILSIIRRATNSEETLKIKEKSTGMIREVIPIKTIKKFKLSFDGYDDTHLIAHCVVEDDVFVFPIDDLTIPIDKSIQPT